MKNYSNDQLRKLSDEDLIKEYLSVRSDINRAKKKKDTAINLEVYFCYISREVQERGKRKSLVKKYV